MIGVDARCRARRGVVVLGLVLVGVGLAACAGRVPEDAAPSPGEIVPTPKADAARLSRDLEATVLENYALLELGNLDAFADRVAPGRAVGIFGASSDHVVAGISPPSLYEDKRLFAGERLRMLSRNLDTHLSASGHVGWAFDEVSYRITRGEREAAIPLRVTGVYTRDVDTWVLAMEHQSYPMHIDEILARAASDELPAAPSFQTAYDAGGPARELRRIAQRVVAGEVGPHYRERHVAESADALVILPGPRHEYTGRDIRDAPTVASAFGAGEGEDAEVRIGDHLIEVADSGDMAWMMSNLKVRVPGAARAGDPVGVDLRGTFLFENRPRRGWVLLQMHVSVGVADALVWERLFGRGALSGHARPLQPGLAPLASACR